MENMGNGKVAKRQHKQFASEDYISNKKKQ